MAHPPPGTATLVGEPPPKAVPSFTRPDEHLFPLDDQAQSTDRPLVEPTDPGPAWYEGDLFNHGKWGLASVATRGAMTAVDKIAQTALGGARSLWDALPVDVDPEAGQILSKVVFGEPDPLGAADRALQKSVKSLAPDPHTNGALSNAVFGVADVGTQALLATAAAGPEAAPMLMGMVQGHSSYRNLREQGVDDATAQGLATVDGTVAALGMKLPMSLPASYLARMGTTQAVLSQLGTGAATNVGLGGLSRWYTSAALRNAGYDHLADQSHVFDGQAILADALVGTLFGAAGAYHNTEAVAMLKALKEVKAAGAMDPSLVDAARVVQNAREFAIDRAPGVPTTTTAANTHAAAMEEALSAIGRDQPVNLGHLADDSVFAASPDSSQSLVDAGEIIRQEFAESGLIPETMKLEEMTDALNRRLRGEPPPAAAAPELPATVAAAAAERDKLIQQISTPIEGMLVGNPEYAAEQQATLARVRDLNQHIANLEAAPLRPEGTPTSAQPTAPPGPRWWGDRGAMPGEPVYHLDMRDGDIDTSRAAIIEHDVEGTGNSTWEAVLPSGKSLGKFDTPTEAAKFTEAALKKAGEQVPRSDRQLTPAQRDIETRFAEDLAIDYEGAVERYNAIPDTQGGKVMSVDTARELSADYLADRSQSEAVHEPGSWFIKRLYAEKLAQPPGPGEEPLVLFTGGGTGAGKTTALATALGPLSDRAQIIYDTNMNGAESAARKIQQAREAGKNVALVYTYKDVISALKAALGRAKRQEGEHGTGRTVPTDTHLETHIESNATIRKLAEKFKGDKGVTIDIIDNSGGKGKAFGITLEQLERLDNLSPQDYNSLREKAYQTVEAEFRAGRISEAIRRGFNGEHAAAGSPGQAAAEPAAAATAAREPAAVEPAEPAGAGNAAAPEPERAGRSPDRLETVMTPSGRKVVVRHRVVELPDLVTSDQPGFPKEIQPRDRAGRASSASQIADIAQRLEPHLLGSSAEADRGAPIVGPDGVVESGNGRALALKEVYAGRYANSAEKAAAYRQFLEEQGHDLTGIKEPVLVRERETELSPEARRAFSVEANQSTTAELAPVERAQADAKNIDAGTMAKLASGDLTTVANAPFVRDFAATLPESERGAFVDASNVISQAGVRRLQAAILAKAYGGSRESNVTLGRMLESTDESMKSTLNALTDAAPAFARLRQMVDDGTIGKEFDIAPAIIAAVEDAVKIRGSGKTLAEHMATADMFSPKALAVKAFFDQSGKRLAGRDAVASALIKYADQAMAQRLNQGNLFSDAPASPAELMQNAVRPKTGDMFGVRAAAKETGAKLSEVPRSLGEKMPKQGGYIGARRKPAERAEIPTTKAPDAETVAEFETAKSTSPEVGRPMLVARVADRPTLAGSNAGNVEAIAWHLMRLDDFDRPQPVGAEKSNTVYIHEVVPQEPFGRYQRGSQGIIKGETLGRNKGFSEGTTYSFPPSAKYTSKVVLELPIDEIRSELKARTGDETFDDAGTRRISKVISELVNERLRPQKTGDAPADAARAVLADKPNLEMAGRNGETVRARAALVAADDAAESTNELADLAVSAATDCFARGGV